MKYFMEGHGALVLICMFMGNCKSTYFSQDMLRISHCSVSDHQRFTADSIGLSLEKRICNANQLIHFAGRRKFLTTGYFAPLLKMKNKV